MVDTSQYHAIAIAAAQNVGLDPALFVRQIQQESGFNPHAKSGAGAIGIAQIVPKFHPGVDPTDPVASLQYAAKHMAGLVSTYQKNGHDLPTSQALALAAYNAGAGAVKKYNGIPPFKETQNYVKIIMGGSGNAPGKQSSGQQAGEVIQTASQPLHRPSDWSQMVDVGGQMVPNVDPAKMGLQPSGPMVAPTPIPQVQSSLPALMASIGRDRARPTNTNFAGDLVNSAINQGSFNTANLPHGNGVGSAIGTGIGGIANAATGVGLLGLTPFAPEVTVPVGLGLAGLAGGASAEARSQLNQSGHITNPLAVGVQGATTGLMNLIPGSQAESFLARAGANALRFGAGGAAADVIGQGVRGGQYSPMETINATMMGGGMGVGAAAFHPAAQVVPEQSSLQPKFDAIQATRDQAPFIINQRMSPEIAASRASALGAVDQQMESLLGQLGHEGQRVSPDPVQPTVADPTHMTLSPNKQFGFRLNAAPTERAPLSALSAIDQQMEAQLNGLRAPAGLADESVPGAQVNSTIGGANNGTAQFDTRAGDGGDNPSRPVDQSFARPTAARRYVNELTQQGFAPDEIVSTTKGAKTVVTVAPKEHPAEVQAALDQARQGYMERMQMLQRQRQSGLLPEERFQANSKAAGMQHAAERRQIIQGDSLQPVDGGLTPKELSREVSKRGGNYNGKPVLVDGKEGTVIGGAYGRVKVQLPDGEVVNAEPSRVEPVLPAERSLAGLGDSAPASATSMPIADHDIGVARLAADAHPNRSISLEQFQQQHPGTFESMSPHEQEVLKATFGAIGDNHALDLNYRTKTGTSSTVDYKRLTPAYVNHGDNSIQLVGLNGNGDWIKPTLSKKLADSTFGSPLESEGYGFKDVPTKSADAPVVSQRDASLRPVKTADDVLRQQAGAFQRLAERFPSNPSIQAMARDFEKEVSAQSIQKNLKRLQTLSKEEADAFLQEQQKRC